MVSECRIKRRETRAREGTHVLQQVSPKRKWTYKPKDKQVNPKQCFDICLTTNEILTPKNTSIVEHVDDADLVKEIVSPIIQNEEVVVMIQDEYFTGALYSHGEFPVLSVNKLLEVSMSSPTLTKRVSMESLILRDNGTSNTEVWTYIPFKSFNVSKFGNNSTSTSQAGALQIISSPSKFDVLNEMAENSDMVDKAVTSKSEVSSSLKVLDKPPKGKSTKGFPNVTTRKQASSLVNSGKNVRSSVTSQPSSSKREYNIGISEA